MVRGAGTLFRTVMAGLLVLAALVLFAMPSTAQATTQARGHHQPCAATVEPAAERMASVMIVLSAGPADEDGCGRHHNGKASVCCVGGGCPMMHGGMAPAGLLPMPSPETAAVPLPPNRLSEGIGTRPGLRPPRTPV